MEFTDAESNFDDLILEYEQWEAAAQYGEQEDEDEE